VLKVHEVQARQLPRHLNHVRQPCTLRKAGHQTVTCSGAMCMPATTRAAWLLKRERHASYQEHVSGHVFASTHLTLCCHSHRTGVAAARGGSIQDLRRVNNGMALKHGNVASDWSCLQICTARSTCA
jgi:hypothetical protein